MTPTRPNILRRDRLPLFVDGKEYQVTARDLSSSHTLAEFLQDHVGGAGRQACAEGRVADAEALYAELDDVQSGGMIANRWLFLKTLGRDDEATTTLLPYDTPDGLSTLSGFLNYTSFDPADFPVLNEVLLSQGITRPPATEIPFACKRLEE